jgi:hypothetical protein
MTDHASGAHFPLTKQEQSRGTDKPGSRFFFRRHRTGGLIAQTPARQDQKDLVLVDVRVRRCRAPTRVDLDERDPEPPGSSRDADS